MKMNVNWYVLKAKPLRNFNIIHQLLIAGPLSEKDATWFALEKAKIDNTWSYHIIELVKE